MLEIDSLSQYAAVAAGLGTAAYALVDGSKAFNGGVSNYGLGHIRRVVSRFYPKDRAAVGPLPLEEVLATLKANWLNGTALADQKAIAKSLIKLRMNEASAPDLAEATGLDKEVLKTIAKKIVSGGTFTQQENDVYGRFDLMLTAILDEGYQRADQAYRNGAKAWSIGVSVVFSLIGKLSVDNPSFSWPIAIMVGLAATPIAPIAKDLTSALQAGVKAAQAFKK